MLQNVSNQNHMCILLPLSFQQQMLCCSNSEWKCPSAVVSAYKATNIWDQKSWKGSISASDADGTECISVSGYSSKFFVSPACDNFGTIGGWKKVNIKLVILQVK